MSISYAATPYKMVDSQFGTGSTGNIKQNVPNVWDTKFHRKVQEKIWWAKMGMIGEDTFTEGSVESTTTGYPILRKTNFMAAKGDTLVMNQEAPIVHDVTSSGIVGANQLVDNEVGWDTNYLKVKLEEWAQAVRTDGGMNEKRSPYDVSFASLEVEKLSDWGKQIQDTSILYAFHYGNAPHMYRQYGTTNIPPTAVSNTLVGNDFTLDTTRTVANLTGGGADNLKVDTFRIITTYALQNNWDLVESNGEGYVVVLISPYGRMILEQDKDFKDSAYYAAERGMDNPIFKRGNPLIFGKCAIFEYDKIRTILGGYNPAGLTVSNAGAYNSSITEAVYTGIGGGVTSSQLHQTLFFGANALGLAEGQFNMLDRKEDDYGRIIGRGVRIIFNAKRMDWLTPAGAASNNTSSGKIINTITL